MKEATVVGGGLVGSLLALMLARRGTAVKLFERRPDLRKAKITEGRSINLALSDRGWRALERAGVAGEIKDIAIPMYSRCIHNANGTITYQQYGKEGQAIYSVSRGELNRRLLELCGAMPQVELFFEHRCTGANLEAGELEFATNDGRQISHRSEVVFASDGAFSAVRSRMQRTDRFDYEQRYLAHGYRELLLPAGPSGSWQLDKNALHIWPREDYMLIALANANGSFTCTLFMPFEGPNSFENLNSAERIDAFFKKNFADFHALLPDVPEEYNRHPLSSLVIIKCYPWVVGKCALIGDSAHAIVPFYGQGMNAGFEDCTVLDTLLEAESSDNLEAILQQYQRLRKPDADAIAELALQNYVEMRDLVADPGFLLRKKIEAWLHQRHPDKWVPLYSQVTFSHTRYSEALANGQRQQRIMDEVMKMPDIEDNWQREEVEKFVLEKLASAQRVGVVH